MRKKVLLGVIPVVAAILMASAFTIADGSNQPKISLDISASGSVRIAPEELVLQVSVESQKSGNKEASKEVADTLQKIIDTLKADGVKSSNIQSGTISVQTGSFECFQAPCSDTSTARAELSIQIRNLNKAGKTLSDILAINGATINLNSAVFDVRDRDALIARAEGKAVANARAQAEGIASASKLHVRKLTNISLGEKPVIEPIATDAHELSDVAKSGAMKPAIPILPGTQDVTAQVTVTYEMS